MRDKQRLDWIQKRGEKPYVQWKHVSWAVIGSHVDVVCLPPDGKTTFPTLREAIDGAAIREKGNR